MSKTSWKDPFADLASVQQGLDELFNKSKVQLNDSLNKTPKPADVYIEDGKRVVTVIETEGYGADELSIKISGNILEIMGHRTPSLQILEENAESATTPYHDFYKQIVLPVRNTKNRFSAVFKDEKLRIQMPLATPAKL